MSLDKNFQIELNSVGCSIDFSDGNIYPQTIDDEVNEDDGVLVMECDIEWFKGLDENDFKIVSDFYKERTGWDLDKWLGMKFPELKKGDR